MDGGETREDDRKESRHSASALVISNRLPHTLAVPSSIESLRVLVVDDDADQLNVLQLYLSANGFTVRCAFDGLDGYATAVIDPPDAIVLDVMMPVVDGWTVARKLMANPRTSAVPLVIVTAADRDEVRLAAASLGITHVIHKPAQPEAIARALRTAVRSAPSRGR
jgi:CheY-like chemotaxis protein